MFEQCLMCVWWGIDWVCALALVFCKKAIFHPVTPSPTASQAHMMCLQRAKSSLKSEWVCKVDCAWMGPCWARIHSCVDKRTNLWSLPHLEGLAPDTATYHQDRRWWVLSASLNLCPSGAHKCFLASSCSSDECVTRSTWCRNNARLLPFFKWGSLEVIFLGKKSESLCTESSES